MRQSLNTRRGRSRVEGGRKVEKRNHRNKNKVEYISSYLQSQENSVVAAESKHKAWQKQGKGKKKGGKAKPKKTKQPYQWKKPVQTVGAKTETETTEGVR